MILIDPIVSFCNSKGFESSGTVVNINSSSVTIETYSPDQVFFVNETLPSLSLVFGGSCRYNGPGVITDVSNHSTLVRLVIYLTGSWNFRGFESLDNQLVREDDWHIGLLDSITSHTASSPFFEVIKWTQQIDMIWNGLRKASSPCNKQIMSHQNASVEGLEDLIIARLPNLDLPSCDSNDSEFLQLIQFLRNHSCSVGRQSGIMRLLQSDERPFYLNFEFQEKLNSSELKKNARGAFVDLLLDEFLGISLINQRGKYFASVIKDKLQAEDGEVRVLVIGTDYLAFELLDLLTVEEWNRVTLEIITYCEEPIDDLMEQIHSQCVLRRLDDANVEGKKVCFKELLKELFSGKKEGNTCEIFDLVLSCNLFQSLPDKWIVFLVEYYLTQTKSNGGIKLFFEESSVSPLREYWAQWFQRRGFLSPSWQQVLSTKCEWDFEKLEIGALATFSNQSAQEI
ncbi:MAG: hypothetical protein MI748_20355 [Opitutales bacterium]|nr:hypothetical protein [Opitutales bacterium]